MTNEEAKVFLDNLKICINEHPIVADWLVEIADRKTEPQTDTDFTLTYTCSFSDCENFKHFGFGEKCIECKRKQSKAMRKTEPQTCDTCKWGEWYRKGYDITMMSDECGGCCSWNNKWKPKTEPQTDCSWK